MGKLYRDLSLMLWSPTTFIAFYPKKVSHKPTILLKRTFAWLWNDQILTIKLDGKHALEFQVLRSKIMNIEKEHKFRRTIKYSKEHCVRSTDSQMNVFPNVVLTCSTHPVTCTYLVTYIEKIDMRTLRTEKSKFQNDSLATDSSKAAALSQHLAHTARQ